jgi:polyhydroxybutyrate depolymerase
MRLVYLTLALAALAALAFVAARMTGGRWRRRVARYAPVGLLARRYVVWLPIPRRQKRPVGVVLAFHGEGGTLELLEAQAALHTARAATNLAIVYPEGYHLSWNSGGGCGDAKAAAIDDTRFVRRILDDLETLIRIDRRRVYATGFANGAMLCYYLACTMSEEIAAIAPVGGGMFVAGCAPRRALPIFHLHGADDERAPYSGRAAGGVPHRPPAADGIAFWRGINGAHTEARERLFGGGGDCRVYSGGPADADIRVCLIAGLGHRWPGPPAGDGRPDAGMSEPRGPAIVRDEVNAAILDFFTRHTLPERLPRRISLDLGAAPPPSGN